MHSFFLPQTWFGNRRQKWKKEQKKGIVGPSGIRPVLPGSSLIQPSYQRSFQNTVGFSRSAEIPSVPLQWFPSSLQSFQAPLESALNPVMRATAAEPVTLRCQQFYSPFRAPMRRITQQYPGTNYVETAASAYPPCHSVPPEIHQIPNTDHNSLADEFPFPYSIARELPHIFGDMDGNEDLECPLTPSFEPVSERSTLPSEDFDVQSSRYASCCLGSYEDSSVPPTRDISCGYLSKGSNFRFYRQD